MVLSVRGMNPKIGEGCYLAPNCSVIGDVTLGMNSSVWFNAVVRGDVMPISIGRECNIQDGTIVHGTYQKCGTTLDDRVSVGHAVILHGCTVGSNTLIGMGAILMDNVRVGPLCLVGAGALLTENSVFEEGSLIIGSPAKVKRKLDLSEIEFLKKYADKYLFYKSWYQEEKK